VNLDDGGVQRHRFYADAHDLRLLQLLELSRPPFFVFQGSMVSIKT